MSDEIVIRYNGDISALESKLEKVEKDLLSIEKDSKKSMNTLSTESNKTAASVQKVDKQVNSLGGSLGNLANKLPFAGAVQQVNELGSSITDAAKATGGLSKGLMAFGAVGLAIGAAIGAVTTFFKTTEKGGDTLAKITTVAGAVFDEFAKMVSQIGEDLVDAFVKLTSSTDDANKSTDDYSKTVIELASDIADLEDHISELTITLDLQNDKLQTGIERNLRALRNQTNTYEENLDLIFKVGAAEEKKLANTNKKLDEELKKQRLIFIQKSTDLELSKKAVTVEGKIVATAASLFNVDKATIEQRKQKAELFDKFVKGEIDATEILANAGSAYTEEQLKNLATVLHAREAAVRESGNVEERLQNLLDANDAKNKAKLEKEKADKQKASDDERKRIEQLFQLRLKLIAEEEKLAIGRAKLEDKTQGDILKIEDTFNGKRIDLFKEFNKTQENDYKSLLLKDEELEKAYTQFLVDEEKKRIKDAEKHAEELVNILNESFQEENNAYKINNNKRIQDLRDSFKSGLIDRKSFEEQSAQLAFEIQKEGVEREIELIDQELQVENLSHDKRVELETKSIEKKQDLHNLEFDHFSKLEEDKTKKAKEEEDKRNALRKQALTEFVNISSTILTGLNDIQHNQATQSVQNDLAANEQKTADLTAELQKRKDAGLITEEQFNTQKARIDAQAKQKESQLKQRQFQADQKAAIANININTAVGVAKTLASYGFTPAGAIAAAALVVQGEIQKALVRSQPVPKFAEGGEIKGKKHSSGGVLIEAEGGEYITKASQTSKYKPVLSAINDGYFDKYVNSNFVIPALKKEEARKRALIEKQAGTAENIMKALELNGFGDLSHLERLTKSNKKVVVENLNGLPAQIGKEISRNMTNNNYMK